MMARLRLLLIAALMVALPAQAVTPQALKPFFSSRDSYNSHARSGDVVLLLVDDEAAVRPAIVNLKTRQKYPIVWNQMHHTNQHRLIYLRGDIDCEGPAFECPKAGGIQDKDVKQHKQLTVEFRLATGKCRRFDLLWSDKLKAYDARDRGISPCSLKLVL